MGAKADNEDELNHTFKVGESSGLTEAATFLLEEAMKFFQVNADKEALLLRRMAEILRKRGDERHPGAPKQ